MRARTALRVNLASLVFVSLATLGACGPGGQIHASLPRWRGDEAPIAPVASDGVGKARGHGSSATLLGDQRLAVIFVSDAGADPWTKETRATVERHVASALRWHEAEAARYGAAVSWRHMFFPTDSPSFAVSTKIDEADYTAGPHHASWESEAVSRLTGESGSVRAQWKTLFRPFEPDNGESGKVALFCVRRWVPSVAFPYVPGENEEFSAERGIIYDNGGPGGQLYLDSQIAHEILHLYGAIDLDPNKIPPHAKDDAEAINAHTPPNEVMHTPTQKPIATYTVAELTAWLVGWKAQPPSWLAKMVKR